MFLFRKASRSELKLEDASIGFTIGYHEDPSDIFDSITPYSKRKWDLNSTALKIFLERYDTGSVFSPKIIGATAAAVWPSSIQ